MKKSDELARLAGVVFEGADPKWKYAVMFSDGGWLWFTVKPFLYVGMRQWDWCDEKPDSIPYCLESKNQPSTDLPWQETLICRGDYE